MKKFFELMMKDYQKENFTVSEWIIGGIVLPLVLVALMGVAGWMDHLSGLI